MGWGTYLVIATFQRASAGLSVRSGFVTTLIDALVGLAITHGCRAFARASGWITLDLGKFALRVIVASLAMSATFGASAAVIDILVFGQTGESPVGAALDFIRWALYFFAWAAMYFGYALLRDRREATRHRARLEKALTAAQLQALKAQLNPHFLFNSLNSVRALIGDDPALARDAVTQLSRTLRYALSVGQDELVTIDREIEMMNDYLALEALRLGERLRVDRDIPKDACRARLPVMLLQTLVENAIKHGIAQLPEGGTLRVVARLEDGALELEVHNPCPTSGRAGDARGHGIGLRNALERLHLLFGPSASLSLDLSAPGQAAARLHVPQP